MNITVIVGFLVVLYSMRVEFKSRSIRHLLPSLMFILLCIAIPTKTTYFLMLLFTLSLLYESLVGKFSLMVIAAMIIISPIFKFFGDTLGFPLRLWLSDAVAGTMTFAGIPTQSVGNLITIGKFQFYIDQACAGLNMLNLSLLVALFLAASHEKKRSCSVGMIPILALLMTTFLLNILSNYFRILLIVLFKIMPGNLMHDLAGIICLTIYVIIPLACFGDRLLTTFTESSSKTVEFIKLRYCHNFALLTCIPIFSWFIPNIAPVYQHRQSQATSIKLEGYSRELIAGDVIKMQNETALIYLKPTQFYAPEHNPMICWTGSGYEFTLIRKERILNIEIYMGTLQKGKEKVYAAWWFDDGVMKTTKQWEWRWHSLRHKKNFYLVNVNAGNPQDLQRVIKSLLPSPFARNL